MRISILVFSFVFFVPALAFAQCINPAGDAGDLIYNSTYDVFQGCTTTGWKGFHRAGEPPDPCTTGPVGTACADGALYAGNSPDGTRMYASPTDDSAGLAWNNGTATWADSGMVDCTSAAGVQASCEDGFANTTLLYNVGMGPSPAPYQAARLCRDKGANWFLPSVKELLTLSVNRASINMPPVAQYYWTSSENTNTLAIVQAWNDFSHYYHNKNNAYRVRCVRR